MILMGFFQVSVFYDSMVNGRWKKKWKQNKPHKKLQKINQIKPIKKPHFSVDVFQNSMDTKNYTFLQTPWKIGLCWAFCIMQLSHDLPQPTDTQNNPDLICDPFSCWIFAFISLFVSWYPLPISSSFCVDITKFWMRLNLNFFFLKISMKMLILKGNEKGQI